MIFKGAFQFKPFYDYMIIFLKLKKGTHSEVFSGRTAK